MFYISDDEASVNRPRTPDIDRPPRTPDVRKSSTEIDEREEKRHVVMEHSYCRAEPPKPPAPPVHAPEPPPPAKKRRNSRWPRSTTTGSFPSG